MGLWDGLQTVILNAIMAAIFGYGGVTVYQNWPTILKYSLTLANLLSAITGLLNGFIEPLLASNPNSALLFSMFMNMIGFVVSVRIYNIIADTQILGFKLPKIPL